MRRLVKTACLGLALAAGSLWLAGCGGGGSPSPPANGTSPAPAQQAATPAATEKPSTASTEPKDEKFQTYVVSITGMT